jgi:hypothetical protein
MFRLAAAVLVSGLALPGDGLLREPVVIRDEQGVALGDLYVKSPTLRWEAARIGWSSITKRATPSCRYASSDANQLVLGLKASRQGHRSPCTVPAN